MDKPTIFIASSENSLQLAETLRDELLADNSVVDTWKDAYRKVGAQAKIEMLEQWSKKYDYAVIIFSKADMRVANLKDEGQKTRDDCVFEAGLFMAAIGRDRCFLLSSVGKDDLPSDLGGIQLLEFKEFRQLLEERIRGGEPTGCGDYSRHRSKR